MNKKWILPIILVVGLLCFLNAIQGVLLPFVLAFVLAYLLNPSVSWLGKRIGRSLASGIMISLLVIFCVLLVFLLIPVLQSQISNFIGRVPLMADNFVCYLKKLVWCAKPEISYQ